MTHTHIQVMVNFSLSISVLLEPIPSPKAEPARELAKLAPVSTMDSQARGTNTQKRSPLPSSHLHTLQGMCLSSGVCLSEPQFLSV